VSTGSEELQQLRHFAKRRLANPHGHQYVDMIQVMQDAALLL
jgi:hypothetical protein